MQIEYIWVSECFSQWADHKFNIASEEALDTGIYIVRSRVYPGHLHDAVLGLIVVNFQARYAGLCSVMYVYVCCDTYQSIPDRFASVDTLCVSKP